MVKKSTKELISNRNHTLSFAARSCRKCKCEIVLRPIKHPNEEINEEENVEGQVDLLHSTLVPRHARLHLKALPKLNCLPPFFQTMRIHFDAS